MARKSSHKRGTKKASRAVAKGSKNVQQNVMQQMRQEFIPQGESRYLTIARGAAVIGFVYLLVWLVAFIEFHLTETTVQRKFLDNVILLAPPVWVALVAGILLGAIGMWREGHSQKWKTLSALAFSIFFGLILTPSADVVFFAGATVSAWIHIVASAIAVVAAVHVSHRQ